MKSAGIRLMVVSCTGYLDGAVARIEVSRGSRRVAFGDFELRENVVLLGEVTVTQQKLKGVEEIDYYQKWDVEESVYSLWKRAAGSSNRLEKQEP